MRLWEALQVRKGEVISFVGAGGKTTAMYRLGRELAAQGWRVITTTTTMIRPPSPKQAEALEKMANLLEQIVNLWLEAAGKKPKTEEKKEAEEAE